jgi:hypothetical protein
LHLEGNLSAIEKKVYLPALFNYNRTAAQFKVERVFISFWLAMKMNSKDEEKLFFPFYQNIIQMESVVLSIKIIRLRMIKEN